jgi:hypothetical protein
MRGFFSELKHRRVYRVALAYGVAASALCQIGGTIVPIFHSAEWLQQLFVVLIALGFPFALVLAWAFDITSTGIQRTESAAGLRVTHRRQIWVLAAVGTASHRLLVLASLEGQLFTPNSSAVPEKSIAVLPSKI